MIEPLMASLATVVIQYSPALVTIGSCLVLLEIDLLIFHSTPKSFNYHVVNCESFAIHVDRDIAGFVRPCKFLAGDLRTLIGVE